MTTEGQNNDGTNATEGVPAEAASAIEESPSNNEVVRTSATSGENFAIPASAVEPAPTGVKCTFCPHGPYAVFPAVCGIMGWFACLSKDGCDYARVTGPIVADITNDPEIPYIDAGLNYYRVPVQIDEDWAIDLSVPCEPYNTDVVDIDAAWTFAKITAFLSLVLGGAGALFIWFSTCFVFKKYTWRWAGYEMLAATALLALTYTWFATSMCHGNDGQDSCTLQYGARVDILAIGLWTLACLFIFVRYPKERVKGPQASNASQQPPMDVEMTNQPGAQSTEVPADDRSIV